MQSDSIKDLCAALAKAQGSFIHAKKDTKNEFFRSQYADLASVIDAAKKPLSDNGLSVSQIVDTDESGNISLETILMHVSGEWLSGKYPVRPVKTDPQAMGSAITYARRYAFSAITGIAADDDDGNSASHVTSNNGQSNFAKANITPANGDNFKAELLKINAAKSLDDLKVPDLTGINDFEKAELRKAFAAKKSGFGKIS